MQLTTKEQLLDPNIKIRWIFHRTNIEYGIQYCTCEERVGGILICTPKDYDNFYHMSTSWFKHLIYDDLVEAASAKSYLFNLESKYLSFHENEKRFAKQIAEKYLGSLAKTYADIVGIKNEK